MGLLDSLVEGDKKAHAESARDKMVSDAARLYESTYADKYPDMSAQFESTDYRERMKAATTVQMIENTRVALETAKEHLGESVVQASLGSLNPRVLDVVRVFYPQQIAQEILDIQPLTGQVGQIFVLKPRYGGPTDGVPGVTYNNQMFLPSTYATYNNYASEYSYLTVGTGNASTQTFTNTLVPTPVRPTTVVVTAGTVVATDDGNGNLTGTGVTSGTVNYTTGAISITYTVAPGSSVAVLANWRWNSEIGEQSVRTVQFDLQLIPVQAKIFPLTFKYSVAAGLAASSHLAVDVQDTLTNVAATQLKIERDNRIISLIYSNATHDTTLDFNASMTSVNYDKRSLYGQIEIKLDQAQSLIQENVGRGGLDFVIAGYEACNVFAQCRSFKAEPVRAPIGSYKFGTLRDGTIALIKSLTLDKDTFIFGFKGYTAGDSATILAEWIPLYSTPLFQNPTFNNQQGLCSLYDLFVNNAGYYYYG
jgi:hypothetical protein